MKNLFIKPLIAITLFLLILSCSKDDPVPIHEEEAFTLVTLELTKVGSTETITYNFEVEGHDHGHEEEEEEEDDHDDHEGEHTEIELEPNSSYNVSISFYNDEDQNNIENLTSEVIEEADEHQVFYDITNELTGFSIVSAADDTFDSSGNPLFIKTTWTTTGETSGDVVGYLFHEPTSKTGTTRSDFGGAIDIEIEFEVHIEL
jgi:secreted trypsin-like serine protease|tara:strand:+ start:306 stop:914 length:609 start_codon:yes stop_codon:yes gene_type:complete